MVDTKRASLEMDALLAGGVIDRHFILKFPRVVILAEACKRGSL
jgi:hypothetical protein